MSDKSPEELFSNEIVADATPEIQAILARVDSALAALRKYPGKSLSANASCKLNRLKAYCESAIPEEARPFVRTIVVTDRPAECLESLQQFADSCEDYCESCSESRNRAVEDLDDLACKIHAADERNVSPEKITAHVRRILSSIGPHPHVVADVSRQEIVRNLQNIENKQRMGKTLSSLVDWNLLKQTCPSVGKNSRLYELTVADINQVLLSLRGGMD